MRTDRRAPIRKKRNFAWPSSIQRTQAHTIHTRIIRAISISQAIVFLMSIVRHAYEKELCGKHEKKNSEIKYGFLQDDYDEFKNCKVKFLVCMMIAWIGLKTLLWCSKCVNIEDTCMYNCSSWMCVWKCMGSVWQWWSNCVCVQPCYSPEMVRKTLQLMQKNPYAHWLYHFETIFIFYHVSNPHRFGHSHLHHQSYSYSPKKKKTE